MLIASTSCLRATRPCTWTAPALSSEITRFDTALAGAIRELDAIVDRVAHQIGQDEAAIFRAHRQLLRDPSLISKVKTYIQAHQVDAATALEALLEEYGQLFKQITDPYLQERMADLRDVVGRIQAQLALQDSKHLLPPGEPVILVAPEILPSQALTFDRQMIAGILTESGGQTGHAAILARSLGIPAVSGIRGAIRDSPHRRPDRPRWPRRPRLPQPRSRGRGGLSASCSASMSTCATSSSRIATRKPISADGVPVELLANVNSPADADMAVSRGRGRRRPVSHRISLPDAPDGARRGGAAGGLPGRDRGVAAPDASPFARSISAATSMVPYFGQQRESQSVHGLAQHPPQLRLSGVLPDAAAGHLAGGPVRQGRACCFR